MKSLISKLPKAQNQEKKGWPWTEEFEGSNYELYKEWPKITIITPTYNHGEYIEETIRSILLQNYPNLEYFVIDGGSTDNTSELVNEYDEFINKFISEKDNGQSDAINKGIRIATGELINWINSDDYLLKGALFEVAKFFIENQEISMIYGDSITVYNDRDEDYIAKPFELLDFMSRISIHQPSTFWKREIFDKVGVLDESLPLCMDYDLWMRMIFDINHTNFPVKLTGFRRYEDSKSSNFNDQSLLFEDYRKILSRFFNSKAKSSIPKLKTLGIYNNPTDIVYPIDKIFDKDVIAKVMDRYIYNCGMQEYVMGNRKRSIKLLLSALNLSNFVKVSVLIFKNIVNYGKFFHPYRNS